MIKRGYEAPRSNIYLCFVIGVPNVSSHILVKAAIHEKERIRGHSRCPMVNQFLLIVESGKNHLIEQNGHSSSVQHHHTDLLSYCFLLQSW